MGSIFAVPNGLRQGLSGRAAEKKKFQKVCEKQKRCIFAPAFKTRERVL